jgi:hypothetical protein
MYIPPQFEDWKSVFGIRSLWSGFAGIAGGGELRIEASAARMHFQNEKLHPSVVAVKIETPHVVSQSGDGSSAGKGKRFPQFVRWI